ncbi:MAG: ABC transporter permease [Alphaproteobacteria bacterium]|jgi:ABC-2 type transport system permease protein|nr:ABC transporter permease [Alphaproteobacteria bacterium]MBK9585198.1 ABC transporter permease [Alphaproteobacteria bacterium]MBP7758909.1 ABC transporter permease [Alphaproteobacteria bacterium]MBP7762183.1 ABC transporter permease [Alphaproteobacteria bacterium]MBP7905314.1 ABC transporter permease [Alphaproteobacteria bacterium]
MQISQAALGERRIRGINKIGLYTLVRKEVERFLKVYTQTLIAPAVTTLLFYTVFALAFGGLERKMEDGLSYLSFLAPGLIMMAMAQNAFSNTSSSLVISKIQGNIVDLLMPPLSAGEILTGYMLGSVIRGLAVGLSTLIVLSLFVSVSIHSIAAILIFAVLGTHMMGALGVVAGIWSEKFDQIAAFTNFIVTPLTFLSGTFYRIDILPEAWRFAAYLNPFFYMIDGFRYGFIGHADGSLLAGISILLLVNFGLTVLAYRMLKTGYKIKS